MMDIKGDWLLWFTNFFDKKSASLTDKYAKGSGIAATLANKSALETLGQKVVKNQQKNYINQLIET